MPDGFMSGTDWQQSSGPYCNRYFEAADLWPHGAGSEVPAGDKDVLAAGLHPVLAIGAKANRPCNLTGIVIDYVNAHKVLMNVAHCFVARQYVVNITDYEVTVSNIPDAWDSVHEAGDCVYVDDSAALPAGVTLSKAARNAAGSENPLAGFIMYCQDEYVDSDLGGLHATAGLPHETVDSETEYFLTCVLLTPDTG